MSPVSVSGTGVLSAVPGVSVGKSTLKVGLRTEMTKVAPGAAPSRSVSRTSECAADLARTTSVVGASSAVIGAYTGVSECTFEGVLGRKCIRKVAGPAPAVSGAT